MFGLRVRTEAFLERHTIATDRRSQYAKCRLYISCLSIKRKGCPGSPPKLLKYFYGAMNQKTISCTPSQKCQRVLKVSHSGAVMHGMGKGGQISSHLHPPGPAPVGMWRALGAFCGLSLAQAARGLLTGSTGHRQASKKDPDEGLVTAL